MQGQSRPKEEATLSLTVKEPSPFLEVCDPMSAEDAAAYSKLLHSFFLLGRNKEDKQEIEAVPLSSLNFIKENGVEATFPVLFVRTTGEWIRLRDALINAVEDNFSEKEIPVVFELIEDMILHLDRELSKSNHMLEFTPQIRKVVEMIQSSKRLVELDLDIEKACAGFATDLLKLEGVLYGFSSSLPFHLLKWELAKKIERNKVFVNRLAHCINGINELLALQVGKQESGNTQLDFAGGLLSFDKIEQLTPSKASSQLSEDRLLQLNECLAQLIETKNAYTKQCITFFVRDELAHEYNLRETFTDHATIKISVSPSAKARAYYKGELTRFTKTIKAIRIAELEIEHKYKEELHVSYFKGFDQSYLSDDDYGFFHSFIIVEESEQLMQQDRDWLSLLSSGSLIRIIAINQPHQLVPFGSANTMSVEHLEIAALAIFRRNAYVFQGAANDPFSMSQAISKGMTSTFPSMWNILVPDHDAESIDKHFEMLKAAVNSRLFPLLTYDATTGKGFGAHLSIQRNPDPDQTFSTFELEISSTQGNQSMTNGLTIADFLIAQPEYGCMMEFIPGAYESDELLPLSDYLELSMDEQITKIPYLWMLNKENHLIRAMVPFDWVRVGRGRMDYWKFLQELSGVKSLHTHKALETARIAWENELDDEKAKLRAEFEQSAERNLDRAIRNILNAFLESDEVLTSLLENPDNIGSPVGVEIESSEEVLVMKVEDAKQKPEAAVPAIRSEAWVESDACTSCNDCIDALPGVFKYNDDKQAYVHNPKGGSYSRIVAAAEKCPALCIHPGLPHDKNEPDLEKWVKRGEKYN